MLTLTDLIHLHNCWIVAALDGDDDARLARLIRRRNELLDMARLREEPEMIDEVKAA